MCRVLSVSRSGYYRWRGRPESRRAIENRRLDVHIKAIFMKSKRRYGSPKITDELNDMGFPIGKNRVARRMKAAGLRSIVRRKYRGRPPTRSILIRSRITFCSAILRLMGRTRCGCRISVCRSKRRER